MKRPGWLVLLVFLACIHPVFGDIADNFMAGGIAFTGSGSFSDDVGNPSDPSNQYSHLTVSASPVVTFYLLDFFAFSVAPTVSYASNYNNGNYYQPVLTYGVSVGFTWYPYFDPTHLMERLPDGSFFFDGNSWMGNPNYPLVFALGFSSGPFVAQYFSGKYSSGVAYGGSMELSIHLTPSLGAYYFISERYALDVILNPTVSIPVMELYGASNSPTNFYPANDVQFTPSVSFGITFFVPWAERSQIRK